MPTTKGKSRIEIVTSVMQANDRLAEQNRRRFAAAGVCAIDLIGSPGAGKTSLLEVSIPKLSGEMRAGVLAGDIATTRDAERIAALGVPVVQITTESFGGACHLEAGTVGQSLDKLDLDGLDVLFIENVGNLVCPAEFDIGHNARVVLLSVTEGEDKPLKYPLAFLEADLALITKTDLVPHLDVDLEALRRNVRKIHPRIELNMLSARSADGVGPWIDWVRRKVAGSTESRS
jgi:hydrogenase nickel incorporation protein HypB